MKPGERALVIIPGAPGAIVATDRRVIVERTATPLKPEIFAYQDLTGAVARLEFLSRRVVALDGPGLRNDLGTFAVGRSRNGTVISPFRLERTRVSVADLNTLISAMNAEVGALGSPAIASPDGRPDGSDPGVVTSPHPIAGVAAVAHPAGIRQRARSVPPRAWIALGLFVVLVLVVGGPQIAAALGGPGHVTTLTFLTADSGTLISSVNLRDPTSGWQTGTSPAGSTWGYASAGYAIAPVSQMRTWVIPTGISSHEQISLSVTGTEPSGAPDGAGFGVVCLRGSGASMIHYDFVAGASGAWAIERVDGDPNVPSEPMPLDTGFWQVSPAGTPVTVVGVCATLAGGKQTRLKLFVGGASVADITNSVSAGLPGSGWRGGIVAASGSPASTMTATGFLERDLSQVP